MFLSIDLFNCKLSAWLLFLFISSFNSKISALVIYNLSLHKSSTLQASLSSTIRMYPFVFCLLWNQVGIGFLLRYALKHASACRFVQSFKEYSVKMRSNFNCREVLPTAWCLSNLSIYKSIQLQTKCTTSILIY